MPALTSVSPPAAAALSRRAPAVSAYTLFWIFLLTAFLGAAAETGFMLLTRGQLQNRSGLLYGQLSLVWGLGAVLFTLLLRGLYRHSGALVFLAGTVAGSVYEYLCSWFQEAAFGLNFWDYRHLPLNLNGRINLLFSLFWGLAALVWVKLLLAPVCRWIGNRPGPRWRTVTAVLAVALAADIALTCAALTRMDQRHHGVPAHTTVARFLDRTYPDQRLERQFSTLTYIGTPADRHAAGMD